MFVRLFRFFLFFPLHTLVSLHRLHFTSVRPCLRSSGHAHPVSAACRARRRPVLPEADRGESEYQDNYSKQI